MDAPSFDALTRLLGARVRRRWLAGLSGGALAALFGRPALAQQCKRPKRRCGNKCVDVRRDRANCGRCGKQCRAGESCRNRSCVAKRYRFVRTWGSAGSGEGEFNLPRGVAVAATGDVYVADTNNSRIQRFSATGTFRDKWGSLGSGDGQFNLPRGVVVAANGDVYVADTENHRIQQFRLG